MINKNFFIRLKKYLNDITFGISNQYLTSKYKWESYKYLYIKTEVCELNAIKK